LVSPAYCESLVGVAPCIVLDLTGSKLCTVRAMDGHDIRPWIERTLHLSCLLGVQTKITFSTAATPPFKLDVLTSWKLLTSQEHFGISFTMAGSCERPTPATLTLYLSQLRGFSSSPTYSSVQSHTLGLSICSQGQADHPHRHPQPNHR
jgi:hypothetical protein